MRGCESVVAIGTTTSSFRALSLVGGCTRQAQARLFFGLHGSAGMVSEREWALFLGQIVTPRFPDGLTVFEASGQWRVVSAPYEYGKTFDKTETGSLPRQPISGCASIRLRGDFVAITCTIPNPGAPLPNHRSSNP